MLKRSRRTTAAVAILVAWAAAAQAQQQPVSVKLGVLNDRSGVGADITGEGSVVAAHMVEDFKSAERGINVEILSADHQNKPDIGSSIAHRWFEQEGVSAILDVPTSSVGLAVSGVARDRNKVFLNASSAASDFSGAQCSPNTISWSIIPGRSPTAPGPP